MNRAVTCRFVLAALALLAAPAPAAAQSWPMWRHDAGRTGRNPAPALLPDPAEAFALPLGGALGPGELLAADLDLDDRPETVFARGGRLLALHADGRLAWASAELRAWWPCGAADFDGDGRPEAAFATALPGMAVVDGTLGRTRFATAAGEIPFLGTVLPLDADGDGAAELYVADDGCSNGGTGAGRVYAFAGGSGATRTVLRTETHGIWCGRGQILADLQGDGRPEIVAPSDNRIWAYDPSTGFSTVASPSLDTFPWGLVHLAAADLDGDGDDELILASDNDYYWISTAKRLQVLEVQGDDLVSRWRAGVDPSSGAQRFLDAPAADVVAGAPGLEVVSSFAASATAGWEVRVYRGLPDGPTAQVLATIPGAVALGLADLDGDGISEILARAAPAFALDDGPAQVSAYRIGNDGSVSLLWTSPTAVWLPLAPNPAASRSVLPSLGRNGWGAPNGPLLRPGPEGLPAVVFERDADDDGLPETLELDDGPTGLPLASWSPEPRGGPLDLSAVLRTAGGPAWLAVATDDGRVAQLDAALALTDDADGDRVPDVFAAHDLHTPPVVVGDGQIFATDSAGRVALAGPPCTEPTCPLVSRAPLRLAGGADARIAGALAPADSAAPLLVGAAHAAGGEAAVAMLLGVVPATPPTIGLGRSLDTSFDALPAGPLDPAFPDADAVALGLYDPSTGRSALSLVSTGGGTSLWTGLDADGTLGGPLSAADLDGDGVAELLAVRGTFLQAVAATGEEVRHVDASGGGAIAVLDIDGDGRPELFRTGADAFAVERLDRDLRRMWVAGEGLSHRGRYAALARGADATWRIGAVPEASCELAAYAAGDGATLWRTALAGGRAWADTAAAYAAGVTPGVLSSPIAAAAPAGSGSDTLVAGSSDGWLYGVSADGGSLAWSVPLHAAVGEPSLGLTGAGSDQPWILAPTDDGLVHVVGAATLAAPAAVWDGDGTTDPASDADDLDVTHDGGVVAAAWPSVDGAGRYAVQVLTAGDVVVRPWQTVTAPRFVARDVTLNPGESYRVAVRALGPPAISPETASDGFELSDDDAPWVDVRARPGRILPDRDGIDDVSDVSASLSDAVRVVRWRAEVQDAAGHAVRALGGGETGRARLAVSVAWNGRGDDGRVVRGGPWRVVVFAEDGSGHRGRGETTVWVCAGEALDQPACSAETADAGGDGADGADAHDSGTTYPTGGAGGGCACRAGAPAPSSGRWLAATALLLLARGGRRRKGRDRCRTQSHEP